MARAGNREGEPRGREVGAEARALGGAHAALERPSEPRAAPQRRLEEEVTEFRSFLERLRAAKDRAEFDEFMRERRNRQAGSGQGQGEGTTPGPQQPQA